MKEKARQLVIQQLPSPQPFVVNFLSLGYQGHLEIFLQEQK